VYLIEIQKISKSGFYDSQLHGMKYSQPFFLHKTKMTTVVTMVTQHISPTIITGIYGVKPSGVTALSAVLAASAHNSAKL